MQLLLPSVSTKLLKRSSVVLYGSDGEDEDKDKYSLGDLADSGDSPFALPSTEKSKKSKMAVIRRSEDYLIDDFLWNSSSARKEKKETKEKDRKYNNKVYCTKRHLS